MIWPGVLVFAAWTLALVAVLTQQTTLLDHRYLLTPSHLPWLLTLAVFLVAWQVMIIAMMLPSSMPIVHLVALASRRRGLRYGLFCFGCCWALMLVMFGLGVGSLAYRTLLANERTTRMALPR